MSGIPHDAPSSPPATPTPSADYVDSAATTLLASGSSTPAKEANRSGDAYGGSEASDHDDGSDDDPTSHSRHEHEHLLPAHTATLYPPTSAAATEPPPALPPWSSLPHKTQLAILTLARLSEPLTQTSLQAYMFYQLKSFRLADGSAPVDSAVAWQAGLLAAAFTGAQFCTAMLWGRLADSPRMGRKRVILVGLLGTGVGSVGFGFSGSFGAAVCWRALGGALNGNIGVMRTMISEIVRERRFQSRAFLLLPMTFNIGVIVGPVLGGLLADPVGSYPAVFGPGSAIGGVEGVGWMSRWPYALPNVVSTCFLVGSAVVVVFGLEETLDGLRDKPDYGLRFSRWVLRTVTRRRARDAYAALPGNELDAAAIELRPRIKAQPAGPKRKLPFRRIWTPNVLLVLLAHGLLTSHVGTFNSLWFIFLSTPRYNPAPRATNATDPNSSLHLPPGYHPHGLAFTGGLALPPPAIGSALAILGTIGIALQLLLYPRLSFALGTTTSYRLSLCLFPLAYALAPFLALVPSGATLWTALALVLCVHVLARTFALPAAAILLNNASPHPSVLGTVHGIGQSVSALARTVGPVLATWAYGAGLRGGVVGLAWWCLAGVAVLGAGAGRWVIEGDGREIRLEGEGEGKG